METIKQMEDDLAKLKEMHEAGRIETKDFYKNWLILINTIRWTVEKKLEELFSS